MRDIRNICLIDPTPILARAFEAIGCTVLTLDASPAPFFSLTDALAAHSFTPDLVVQREVLGPRSVVSGLDQVDCPTIFWAVDPHLNAYWHSAYARLFDVTCSTQRAWVQPLKAKGAQDVRWLPMYGRRREWSAPEDRIHDLAFVGRITEQRSSRKWMVERIKEQCAGHSVAIEQDLDFESMMQLYLHSRIAPNESIAGEVNFRLFEAASCGCLVLGQDLGDELNALFEPGREMDTFSDVLEFEEKLTRYLANPRLTQAMGKAAYERIHAEHLPEHRAEQILRIASECSKNRVTGPEHEKWTTLTLCALCEAGLLNEKINDMLDRLARLPQDADVANATLHMQALVNLHNLIDENVDTILTNGLYADSVELNLAGSMSGLRRNHWDKAKAFWYRHLQTTGTKAPLPPKTPADLLTLWAKELKRLGLVMRAGFPFNPDAHLATTSVECLLTILRDDHEHLPTLRLLDSILRPIVGTDQMRVGFLSILTLHERKDWRLALEIALVNLKAFRRKSGMEELQLALEIAREQGQEKIFRKALLARDSSGLLTKNLGI